MSEIIDRRISFNAGEISGWLDPRIDLEKYHAACRQLENFRPSIYGGAIRRAGTEYLGAALTSSTAVRLIPFLGGNGTDYVLEFSNLKFRVWDADAVALVASTAGGAWGTGQPYVIGQVVSEAGANYEVIVNHTSGTFATDLAANKLRLYPYLEGTTPYTAAQLNAIQHAQQNDVIYLTHPSHAPQVLLRQSATAWVCGLAKFEWPVTLGPNTTRITILPWFNAPVDTWDSGAAYLPGNHVLSGGVVYKNILASTNHVPPNATYWVITTWSNGKVYALNDTILYSGQYYLVKLAHTAATGREPGTALGETYYAKANRIDAIGGVTPAAYVSTTFYSAGTLVQSGSLYYLRTAWLAGMLKNVPPTGNINSLLAWEQVNATASTYTAAIPKGESITLESSENLFQDGHRNSIWIIAHRRPEARVYFDAYAQVAGYTTDPLYVLGAWSASTTVYLQDLDLDVQIHIERSTDLVNWEFYSTMVSLPVANNQILTGTEDEPVFLRLKLFSKTGVDVNVTVDLVAENGTQYGLAQVTAYTSPTQVTATVMTPIYSYDRTSRWEEPAFTSVRGFPRAVAFHNGRLWFGGITARPTSVWGSTVDAYWDFRTGSDDDRSLAYTVASDESSTIEWLVSQDLLCIGTTSGEWTLGQRPGDDEIRLRRNTSYGSAAIQGRAIGDALVYVQKSRRKLREFAFNYERDGYLSSDLNQLAEHLGDAEMLQMALQRNPESVVWVVTTRGDLLALTYERGQNVAGWCRFTTAGTFESVAIVPGAQEEDHVWFSVVRNINGSTVRYIERIAPDMIRALKDGEENELVFSDCSLVLNPTGTGTSDVVVSGTLTDGTNAVPFPTLGYTTDVFPFPSPDNAGGYSADFGNYKLLKYTGTDAAANVIYYDGTGGIGYTAAATGVLGNLISVQHVISGTGSAVISVAVAGNAITVTAGSSTTLASVITAVNASGPASALVTASGTGNTGNFITGGGISYLSVGINTGNWHLSIGDFITVWMADSTEANPWDIDPSDWIALYPATGTPDIQPASSTITGLSHLEGETVTVLADGSQHVDCTVVSGEITLNYPARTAVVGLEYEATIEPTFAESREVANFSKVGKKRIHSATMEFWKTAGCEISADDGVTWTPLETRTSLDLMDSTRTLFTGLLELKLDGRTERQASVILRSTGPLPLNLLSMNLRYQLNTTT